MVFHGLFRDRSPTRYAVNTLPFTKSDARPFFYSAGQKCIMGYVSEVVVSPHIFTAPLLCWLGRKHRNGYCF